jgi:hypothetical protein
MALIALCVGCAFASGSSARATVVVSKPALYLKGASPIKIKGVRFQPRERVRLILRVESIRMVGNAVASPRGMFTVTYGDTVLDRCSGLFAQATGNRGSSAVKEIFPDCPPAP